MFIKQHIKKIHGHSPNQPKDIKIINKIVLSQDHHIFERSFGSEIFPGNNHYHMNQNFTKTRKKIERRSLCSTIRYHTSCKLYSIGCSKIRYVPEISLYI